MADREAELEAFHDQPAEPEHMDIDQGMDGAKEATSSGEQHPGGQQFTTGQLLHMLLARPEAPQQLALALAEQGLVQNAQATVFPDAKGERERSPRRGQGLCAQPTRAAEAIAEQQRVASNTAEAAAIPAGSG